jgi:2'-5' RNA ligase
LASKGDDTLVSQGMSTGTSSGRAQSAILIPVPEAETLVKPYRVQYDPVAIAGVPAHITLIVPWLPPSEIGPGDLAALGDLLRTVPPFDFSLQRASWFGRGVLWLAPQPTEPFVNLTAMLAERFATLPYEDEFDEVIPHLTVAHATDGAELGPVAKTLSNALPIECRAEQVWVMVGDGLAWSVSDRFKLTG